jgi:hypothetical protein
VGYFIKLVAFSDIYCIAWITAEATADITLSRCSKGAFEPAMNTASATRLPLGELIKPTSLVAMPIPTTSAPVPVL